MAAPTIGLLVNPAAGRDVRRLTGGATVSDTYGKRRAAECVLAGVDLAEDPVDILVAPDGGEIGQRTVAEADRSDVRLLDTPVDDTSADTRRAAEAFRERVDAVVVFGGDGTTRDLAVEIGDVPVLAVSTGTNNVVPTPVDGTVAGAAAAFLATDAVDPGAVTYRHTMVEARVDDGRSIRGLATVGVVDQSFVGTRAVLDPDDFLGGGVSRAGRGEVGLSGVAGALTRVDPDDGRGVALELDAGAERTVGAITVPGVVERVGVAEWSHLAPDEEHGFEVGEAVVSVDGERELEVQNAEIGVRPVSDGPRLVDFDAVFEAAPLAADARAVERR
ncbi:NAD(+)/NADH kinase [Halobellus limi]|uniref:ATP-NAD kinase n=1 Tax=Halobellus limi TaxID=699433 RepID=A0A1H5Z202_9EURY|nr:NAD(+)/NADH kinase [Halobellus limi]SEG30252.1 ATP-NAD kinase [Halobellus limi]